MRISRLLVALTVLALMFNSCVPVVCQCSKVLAFQGIEKQYANCLSLPYVGASLAWNYHPDSLYFDFAFRSALTSPSGWVGWGFNPDGPDMIGGSALIAFQSSENGSNVLPYKLTGSPTPPSEIDVEWINANSSSVEIVSLQATIFATFKLREGQTTLNQLWNQGDDVADFVPMPHALSGNNMFSFGTLDVTTGTVTKGKVPYLSLKNIHGLINGIAWGLFFPVGVMAARYMRPFPIFDPLWFYIHVICQTVGYVLGVAGFGMGLRLERVSGNVKTKHRNIGYVMFALASLQVLGVMIRPKPQHKVRKYWNVYHHSIGFAVLICSIVNIYEGISILTPPKRWKTGYTVAIITLGGIAIILELVTWTIWFVRQYRSRKQAAESKPTLQENGSARQGELGHGNGEAVLYA